MLVLMGVALQAGMLAGGVVFVPMALAGWHLTRNRVLFFSATLFIVLAVSVHLLPYFPSVSTIMYSIHSPWPFFKIINNIPPQASPISCSARLHDIVWEKRKLRPYSDLNVTTILVDWSWPHSARDVCKFQKLKRHDTVDLLRGTWVVIAGDSQLRLFFLSLLDIIFSNTNPGRLHPPERHANYEYTWKKENIRFQFLWAPFSTNLTSLVNEYRRNGTCPDVLVMGVGLWHMLTVTDASNYGDSLAKLQRAVLSLVPKSFYSNSSPSHAGNTWSKDNIPVTHMFWLNFPTLVPSLLGTERKRQRMTSEESALYDKSLIQSKLVRPEGPLTLLNLTTLSSGCGAQCTLDGIHYNSQTYEAAVHLMINTLLIATHQAPTV